ncbi:type IV secretion system protein [Paraburkholderia sp. GAS32]|uniref:type IV secretion system protein n=1 Tax=Paraburkholderia sp. GAS32 TaxID=3035129 RepID=UPI003D1FE3E9
MAITLTTDLFNYVDTLVNSFVSTNVSKIASSVGPAIQAALTLSYMLEGVFLILRPSGEPLIAVIKRFAMSTAIISVATAGGVYQTNFVNAVLKAPDEFASILVVDSTVSSSSSAIGSTIDLAINGGYQVIKTALSSLSPLDWGKDLALGIAIVAVFLSTVIMCGIGAAFIFSAKLMLGLLASLGPLFIFLLLFKATRQFFEKWVGQVVTYGLVVVITAAVFGMMLAFYSNIIGTISKPNPDAGIFIGILSAAIMVVVTYYTMNEIPKLAISLGGGMAAGEAMGGAVSRAVGAAGSAAAGFAGGAAAGAGKAMGKEAAKAMKNAMK